MAQQTFAVDGPVEAAVRLGSGELRIERADAGSLTADVRPLDPGHEPSVRLAATAEIRFDRGRLTVTVPEQGRIFRRGEVVVSLALPAASLVSLRGGAVDVHVTGGLQALDAKLGSGEVHVDSVDGLAVKGGQVDVDVDHAGSVAVSTGQGTLRAQHVGDAAFKTGHGSVELGRTSGNVQVKGGAVQLTVHAAGTGEIHFTTGAGNARVAVQPGTTVQLDLTSGAGDVRCDLPLESSAPSGGAGLRLRLRTGSGDLVVASAQPTAPRAEPQPTG